MLIIRKGGSFLMELQMRKHEHLLYELQKNCTSEPKLMF